MRRVVRIYRNGQCYELDELDEPNVGSGGSGAYYWRFGDSMPIILA